MVTARSVKSWTWAVNSIGARCPAASRVPLQASAPPSSGFASVERVGDPAAWYLRRYRRVRGQMAAARRPAGDDAAPEEANDARLSEGELEAIPDRRERSQEARRSRLGAVGRALARWVAIDAEHCPARAVTCEDIDPEAYVVGNS